ncbi:MAG TPA: EAL domain-containing protein [Candidatus Dormibacteraeota bacterium]|jgi:diguanylate cyclase (GGDEF)-like protein|nr:EAL domain-containing protein [Candidatus Dormibacteraeota bacterium]
MRLERQGGHRAALDAVLPQIATILRSTPEHADVVELLARMLDTLPVGVALLSPEDFTFLYCNPIFERWPAPEMLPVIGKPFALAFPRVVQNRVLDVLRDVVSTRAPRHFRNFPYAGYRGAGPTLPGNVTVWNWDIYPLADAGGRVTHLISTGVDVTEPAVARHRLQEAHERGLQAVVEVARLVAGQAEPPRFFGQLSSTVAQLVGARTALFLRLEGSGLVGQPDAHGLPAAAVEQIHLACRPGRRGLVERIVFDDEVFRARLDEGNADIEPYREVIDRLAQGDALMVSWRAGDEPIGALVAAGSTDDEGFTEGDVWVLRSAGHAAGLVWQQRLAEDRVATTNAEAYSRQQDMVGRLRALVQANLALTQQSDPTVVLRALLDAARELAGAEYAALEVLTPDGLRVDALVHTGAEAAPPAGSRLGVSMVYQDRVIGSLSLTNKLGGAEFSAEDETIITGLAAQAAVAVENARMYQRLVENAATDPLTGLANRREFERLLANLPRRSFAVLAIDVDNLKPVNDEYGHEGGDAVLRAVATTMEGLRRSGDVIARTGGDEFAALLLDTDTEGALQVAERLRVAMHGVAMRQGQARISVGCAEGNAGADPVAVWRAADEALFRAKRHGRDRVEGPTGEAGEAGDTATDGRVDVAHPAQWAATLDDVLTDRSLHPVYQPIVRLAAGGGIAGYEALARPTGYAATTSVEGLFAAAHRLGMIRDLDWLSRRVALASAPLLPAGQPVFVNVSAAALLDPVHGVDQMLLLLRWAGWPPVDVVLEITERETISDLVRLGHVLAAYREHGFRFALDDVGEGHSTLEVLATALPEYVKIARSLTMSSDRRGSVAAIEAAVAFARSTGTTVIAEGVETDAAACAMQRLGVHLGQGWHLAPPGTPDELEVAGLLSPPLPAPSRR